MQKHPTTPEPDLTGATIAGSLFTSIEQSRIEQAATWLANHGEKPSQLIPHLKSQFHLSAVQACEAIAMARRFEINRRAFG